MKLLPLLLLVASAAAAQVPDLPAAPSAPARPLVLPPPTSLGSRVATPATPAPATPEIAENCSAPAEGLYAPQPRRSPEAQRAADNYLSQSIQRLNIAWTHAMPRAASDPWVKGATVTVRFAILPSGQIDEPIVTVSSGRKSYDKHALDAIALASPFDPLPAGVTRALPICMHFGYNTDPGKKQTHPWDYTPPPAAAEPK